MKDVNTINLSWGEDKNGFENYIDATGADWQEVYCDGESCSICGVNFGSEMVWQTDDTGHPQEVCYKHVTIKGDDPHPRH